MYYPTNPRLAVPCVKWLGPEKYQKGEDSTPGGTVLGIIFRRIDGFWAIEPSRNGPVMITNISETQTDALCFLAELLTRAARAIVNGDEKNLRIVAEDDYFLFNRKDEFGTRPTDETANDQWHSHHVVFWDDQHGIVKGDDVRLEVPGRNSENTIDLLEGKVTKVSSQKVMILGNDSIEHTARN